MNWYHIVAKDIKMTLRDRVAWLLMILLPFAVLTIAGFALSGLFSPSVPNLKLSYAFSGDSKNIEPLIHSFENIEAVHLVQVDSKEEGMKLIENSSVTALIVIPEDFNVSNINSKYQIDFLHLHRPH